ncbi:flavin reductase family protein [Gordonia sp. PP30]|uniref:flavin reductase family protein n=1 Tax=unclassified Gordonia (in: high G+C Gram-positive bacteria) TaxID=2657482 RepID=UPI001FFEC273|nr:MULTISPECIES: flavin reductase family protein [unclassified Gordonia (in: high G+C Gram-positive bacteria)]UQE75759.1 flavin reductase family protein [Gordonia sp. PP30]
MTDTAIVLDSADDSSALKRAYSCFPSGVVAVCRRGGPADVDPADAPAGDGPIGMAASAFTTVSLDPPLVSVCVRRESATWPLLRTAPELGVSVFAADQGDLCRQLAGPPAHRFDGVEPLTAGGGALFLPGAVAHLLCTLAGEYEAGDHTVVLLRITSLCSDPGAEPLVFHASTFRALEARRESGG